MVICIICLDSVRHLNALSKLWKPLSAASLAYKCKMHFAQAQQRRAIATFNARQRQVADANMHTAAEALRTIDGKQLKYVEELSRARGPGALSLVWLAWLAHLVGTAAGLLLWLLCLPPRAIGRVVADALPRKKRRPPRRR